MSNDFDLISSGSIRNNYELPSNALLQFINTLDIQYIISCMETKVELQSSGSISWASDFLSDAMLRTWGSADLDSIVHSSKYKDLQSTVYKPYNEELTGNTIVTDLNILDIVFKLIQAPINVLNCSVTQDTYIRESRPTLNYGTAQSLLVGNLLEGKYETLLQIDIRPYNTIHVNNAINVLSINLILKLIGNINSEVIIDVYENNISWNESTTTWSSFAQTFNTLITSFTCETSSIKINLTDYVNMRQNAGYNSVNLVFKVRDLSSSQIVSFESINSDNIQNRPHLEVLYQDNNWTGYIGNTSLNASAVIRTTNSRDLQSISSIKAIAINEILSNASIARYKDLLSNTVIRHTDTTDLSSNAQLLPNKDLIGDAIIRQADYTNLESLTDIYHMIELDSIVEVKTAYAWLNGTTIIQQLSTIGINSSVTIQHNNDLSSNSILRLTKNSDIEGSAIVKQTKGNDILGLANILQYVELISNAIVQRYNNKDLSSIAKSRWTNETDLSSTIQIRGSFDELLSTARIRLNKNTDLTSFMYSAYGTALDSMAELKSQIKSDINDLSSSSTIRNTTKHDLDSIATLHWQINLLSSALVRQLASKDILSISSVNQICDLISSSTINQIHDLVSNVTIRHTATMDILTDAMIRQFDITELDSVAYLFGLETCDLNSSVMVQRMGRDYLDSKVEIQTTARRWIPNVHGSLIFDYEDRKLPRVWKRENFIP